MFPITERAEAIVDLDALRHNLTLAKDKSNARLLFLVKANAYGHGAPYCAKYTEDLVDCFGVATTDEALELKRFGIKKPVMIMGAVLPSCYPTLIRNGIEFTVSSLAAAQEINAVAESLSAKAKIHIAVDTGMGRIGFLATETESVQDAYRAATLPNIDLKGIFTHHAKADSAEKSYRDMQRMRYKNFLSGLRMLGLRLPVCHICNSASVIEQDDEFYDMVRFGIAAYGLYPSDEVRSDFGLIPVMSIGAKIVHLKTIPAGASVGYGATYTADRPTRIATLPLGYADGYPRALSNKGRVLIHGVSCPVVGRVCMDQIMVDVSALDDVHMGDIATILGRDGDQTITAEELGDNAASFNYEFVCGVGLRVPRKYVKDGVVVAEQRYI